MRLGGSPNPAHLFTNVARGEVADLMSDDSTGHRKPMDFDKLRPSFLIRDASVGALTGLLFGLYEAIYLWEHPYPEVLLKPTVAYLIWFLAPLIDGAVAGLVGLGTGLVVATEQGHRTWIEVVRFVRAHWVIAVALVAAVVAADALMGGPYAFHALKVVAIALMMFVVYRLIKPLPSRILGVTLGTAFLLLLAGVGVYLVGPALHATAAAAGPESSIGKPNIILITLDTVRADHLSLYGYPRLTTPNLDRWAREGVVFDNAIAPRPGPSPRTLPCLRGHCLTSTVQTGIFL